MATDTAPQTAQTAQTGRPQLASPGPVLAASLIGFFVIALDALVVNVALPAIGDSVHGGMAGLQWVVTGYTLMFAALMLSAGSLSDRIGAKRAYGSGLALFTAASVLCGLAPQLWLLVAARMVQGAAAALMLPASLALIRQAYPDTARRARAIAVWTTGGAVAAAAGPVAGGLLTGLWGWRTIFFINVPAGVVGLLLLSRTARSPKRPAPLDLPGQLTGALTLASLTYAVIETSLAALAVTVLAAAAFLAVEARRPNPMVPLGLFRSRTVSLAVVAGFAVNGAFYGAIFLLSLSFQEGRGQSALAAGLMFVPMTAVVALVNYFGAVRLTARFGPRTMIAAGQLGTVAGLLALLATDSHTPAALVSALMIPVGFAGALAVTPLTALLLDNVPADRAGTAAGVFNTARQAGGAVAVAAFGSMALRTSLLVAAAALVATTVATIALLRPIKGR
ncbi:MFS transporter [Streptomyces sp. NBC_01465]|uniref:MFS transporter n=1 Tax=Streptomyces sp. NBC_01465 TaxID=2903878 RepID=UPI002E32AD89|nr:MFS transporter [Streptomyces sp. NBC_01465]